LAWHIRTGESRLARDCFRACDDDRDDGHDQIFSMTASLQRPARDESRWIKGYSGGVEHKRLNPEVVMSRSYALAAALLLSAVLGAPNFAAAIEESNPTPPSTPSTAAPGTQTTAPPSTQTTTPGTENTTPQAPQPVAGPTKGKKKSEQTPPNAAKAMSAAAQQFLAGYHTAYALIYDRGDYEAGISALRALGHDENADVATLIGYASRKLGRYDDAKYWYDRALAADPDHAVTWSYYGMWHAEQGNVLKAKDDLEKVRTICGTQCRAYTELQAVIDGTRTY
jgi:tetratricopeptide (TPR) repeat protein